MSETFTISKVIHKKVDSGWSIMKTDRGTIKGVVSWDAKPGDKIECDGGKWVVSKYNGDNEFEFKSARISVPEDSRALLTYAVSLTRGLGEAAEAKIWDKYGDKWREQTTLDIPGIPGHVEFYWQDTLNRLETQANQAHTFGFLLAKGCSLNMAGKAWEKWQDQCMSIVGNDPYILASLPHYGFCHVDNGIRQAFGIADDDPRRAMAGTMYEIGQLEKADGSTLAAVAEVVRATADMLGCDASQVLEAIRTLAGAKKVQYVGEGCIALAEDAEYEGAIADRFMEVAA